jgi:hypothetical protein
VISQTILTAEIDKVDLVAAKLSDDSRCTLDFTIAGGNR